MKCLPDLTGSCSQTASRSYRSLPALVILRSRPKQRPSLITEQVKRLFIARLTLVRSRLLIEILCPIKRNQIIDVLTRSFQVPQSCGLREIAFECAHPK